MRTTHAGGNRSTHTGLVWYGLLVSLATRLASMLPRYQKANDHRDRLLSCPDQQRLQLAKEVSGTCLRSSDNGCKHLVKPQSEALIAGATGISHQASLARVPAFSRRSVCRHVHVVEDGPHAV